MGLKESGLRGSLRSVSTGVRAIPDSVVLQPDAGDLTHFFGDTEKYDINDNQPRIGDLSLKGVTGDTGRMVSTSGLDNYPAKGESSSCLTRPGDGGIVRVGFGAADIDNYYLLRLQSDEFFIEKRDDASPSTLASSSVSITETDFHELFWEWHDGSGSEPDNEIVAELYAIDQSTGERTDPDNPIQTLSVNDSDFDNNTGIAIEDAASNDAISVERYLTGGFLS